MRGRAFGALVKIKKSEATPYYTDLHESLDGVLHVLYKDYGAHKYFRRNDGTIGVEQSSTDDAKEFRVLGFSEENKALLSQSMERCAMPKKVVEWLHGMRSLAEITPSRSLRQWRMLWLRGHMALPHGFQTMFGTPAGRRLPKTVAFTWLQWAEARFVSSPSQSCASNGR